MKKIGVFYSFNSTKTALIAEKIVKGFGSESIESVDVDGLKVDNFLGFECMILGVPTWWDGELPTYWDEFVPAIEELNLTGKKIAMYGLGNQKGYPDNFVDAIGIMANLVESRGANIVGFTSTEGYNFEKSRGVRDGKFVGLALDQENQGSLTNKRIEAWVNQLKQEFS